MVHSHAPNSVSANHATDEVVSRPIHVLRCRHAFEDIKPNDDALMHFGIDLGRRSLSE